jgi:beta propeller repeat protein
MYDLSTSTTSLISKYASSQSYPQISESGIVWQVLVDFYNNYEIYFYEFASEALVPLTTSLYAEENPSIWSNRIVWDDATSGNYDIYYLDFVRPSGADIYVTQTDKPDPILVNGYLTYKITVGNYGFDNATNVTLSNNLSSKEEFYYAESTQGRCDYSGGVVTCNLGDINFKDKVDITIVAIPRDTGYIYNSSTVSANQPDLITSNNSSISKTKVVSYKIEEVPFSREIGELSLDVDSYGSAHISATSAGEFYPKNGDDIIYFTNKNGVWESYRIYDGVADNDSGLGNPHYHLWDGLNSLIALDDQNNVHICYVIYYLDTDVLGLPYDAHYTLKYTNNVGGIWKTAETIATKIEYSNSEYIGAVCRLVSMDIDNNGKAHIAYLTNRAASVSPLYYANNINGQWTNEVIHSSVYDMASMAIDKNNKAHVCFYSYDILENNSHLQGIAYMTNSTNNTWSIPERVDTIGGQMENMGASIVTDNLNNPHVSYLGGPWGNNKYAFKDGANWTIVKVDTGWGSGWSSLNLDSSGKAHILYTPFYGSDTFRYAQNTSGLFEFADIDESFKYQIQIDDQNKFHMVYDDIYLTNREHSIQYGGGETGTGGYYFATSTSEGGGLPSQPTYEWIDPVSEGHSEITSWTSGDADDGYLQISNLGMTFPFFSQNYDHVFIGSNGYISFANGSTDNAEYVFIPSSIQPNNFIAGCAMDLDCGKPDSKVFYHSAGSQFIVTYWHVYDKGSDSDYITFQIILYSSGNIKIQFNDSESIVPAPESIDGNALVGIENHDGSEGLSYHNNGGGGSLFGSPLAIMFGKDPYLLPVESSSFKPIDYLLEQNYPNPFNPNTTISWQIPKDGLVTLKIYDVLGREINTLVNEELNAGKHTVVFDASGFSSGVYFYQIKAGDYIATKKMILIK